MSSEARVRYCASSIASRPPDPSIRSPISRRSIDAERHRSPSSIEISVIILTGLARSGSIDASQTLELAA